MFDITPYPRTDLDELQELTAKSGYLDTLAGLNEWYLEGIDPAGNVNKYLDLAGAIVKKDAKPIGAVIPQGLGYCANHRN